MNKKMNVRNLTDSHCGRIKVLQLGSPGKLYGAERWILALIKHLDKSIVETQVTTIRDEPALDAPLCTLAEQIGFQTKVFECYGRFNFSAVRLLRQYILDNKIDIIHTHHYKTDMIGLLATIGTPCRIVTTPHGWSKHMDFKLWCYEMLDRCIFPFMDAVVPLSRGLYRSMEKVPGLVNKLHYIQNGVDMSEIMEEDNVNGDLQVFKDEGMFVIGYIGQLIYRKGLDVLIKVVSKLGSMKWKLVIVGEGEQRSELEEMSAALGIENNVEFLGFRPDRLSLLNGFDVFVLPSRTEGIPRCLMEAMTAGVPVIASDITGCRELVINNETGLLFPMDDQMKLGEALKLISNDAVLSERLKCNAKDLIIEKFSAERMAGEYMDLFDSLTSTSRG